MATKLFVQSVWKDFLKCSGMEPTLINNLQVIDAVPGKVSLGLTVEQKHTNRLQILHGGTIASIVDLGGSLAVASRGFYSTGVSTDISIQYLSSGGKIGDKILIECTVPKLGRTMAFTHIDFFNGDGERIFARGSHTKYIANAFKDPKNDFEAHKA